MKKFSSSLFALPAMLLLALFVLVPALQVVYYSFFEQNLITESRFCGLQNYINLFYDEKFWAALSNSFLYVLVTPALIIISLALALMVRANTRTNKFMRVLFFIPVITPIVAVGIIWKWMLAEDTGIINYILGLLGILPIKWLSSYPQNMISVMLVTIWRGAGYYMMVFLAGLAVINCELEEAAMIDGAGRLKRIFYIIIPQIRPTVIMVFVISSMSALKIFTELYILIPGAPLENKTLVYFLYREAFERFNFGYGSAAGIALFICVFGFSLINLRLLERRYAE